MDRPTIRIGLVLNGGVSLAVWMGGVTHEIDRLRRSGSRPLGEVSPAWKAILDELGTDVVVDTVAGTSAGGLNGSFLATAIARRQPLPGLLPLWLDAARMRRGALLRKSDERSPRSVLDGGFFQDQITEVMGQTAAGRGDGTDPPGDADEVTLLVTGTAIDGSRRVVRDASGKEVQGSDHRRVYRFSNRIVARPDRGDPSTFVHESDNSDFVDTDDDLEVASRVSAGFPVAFQRVSETPELLARGGAKRASPLMDGGVLDNAPFGPLLDAIRDRPRIDVGRRWVVYVVPSSAMSGPAGAPVTTTADPGLAKVLGDLVGIWRATDLRDDVNELVTATSEARRVANRPDRLLDPTTPAAAHPADAAAALYPLYRRSQAAALLNDFQALFGQNVIDVPDMEGRIAAVLRTPQLCWVAAEPTAADPLPGRTRAMGQHPDAWQWSVGPARRMARWISRDARQMVDGSPATDEDTRREIARIERELEALDAEQRTIIQESVAGLAGDSSDQLAAALLAGSERVVASGLLTRVAERMDRLIATWASARGWGSADEAWDRLRGVEVLSRAMAWKSQGDPPPFALHVVSTDTPQESGLRPTALEGLAVKGPGWPDGKLYGTQFGHFGAFGSARFRQWDWVWGRVDGAVQLFTALQSEPGAGTITADHLTALVKEILGEHELTVATLLDGTEGVLRMSGRDLLVRIREDGEADVPELIDDLVLALTESGIKPAGLNVLFNSTVRAAKPILKAGYTAATLPRVAGRRVRSTGSRVWTWVRKRLPGRG